MQSPKERLATSGRRQHPSRQQFHESNQVVLDAGGDFVRVLPCIRANRVIDGASSGEARSDVLKPKVNQSIAKLRLS